jgi:hypothetical protein
MAMKGAWVSLFSSQVKAVWNERFPSNRLLGAWLFNKKNQLLTEQ